MTTEIATTSPNLAVGPAWSDSAAFEHSQRVAKMFTSSTLVPKQFQGDQNLGNAVIALNMAQRLSADVLAVMQSIYIVHGKPSWASTFVIAMINSSGLLKGSLKWKFSGKPVTDEHTCIAFGTNKDGEELEGPPVSIAMAKAEGWLTKDGSKWKTMPDLMMRYRAATFFGRMYCPEKLLGMHTQEEVFETEIDITPPKATPRRMFSRKTEVQADAPPSDGSTVDVPSDAAEAQDAKMAEVAGGGTAPTATVTPPAATPPGVGGGGAAPQPEPKPQPKATGAALHPRDELKAWAQAHNLTFAQLKEWNMSRPKDVQIGSLCEEALDFDFCTRLDAKNALRHAEEIIAYFV